MSAFKKLKSTDAFVTSYVAKKHWSITGSEAGNYGVQVLYAVSSSNQNFYLANGTQFGSSDLGTPANQGTWYRELVYRSLNQLYYSNYNETNGSILNPEFLKQNISGSSTTTQYTASTKHFYNFEETNLSPVEDPTNSSSGSRYLRELATVYSLPREVIGTHIEPGSFKMVPKYVSSIVEAGGAYVTNTYVDVGYVTNDYDHGSDGYLNGLEAIVDDGEGNLKLALSSQHTNIGNIIYSHGLVILTNEDVAAYYRTHPLLDTLKWQSNQPIYTYNYHAKISDYEFNHTLNPSALTGSENKLRDNVSGSSFQPYITSIGLYNDANELIAIGKLSQPLQKPADTELTIQVKLDI